ncbi:MAG: type II secretion system protein [Bdellovibrionota bacterium]|nr:MAG: type II secretion system protein [Bdellovibrionota bacterium]
MKHQNFLAAQRGFTIVEMLVVALLLGIMSAIAAIEFVESRAVFQRDDARHQIQADIKRAKQEARAAGTRALILPLEGTSSYQVGVDFLPFNDPPSLDQIVLTRRLGSGFEVAFDQPMIFDGRGYLVDEDGELTSTTLTLEEDGEAFASATVYPTGYVEGNDP